MYPLLAFVAASIGASCGLLQLRHTLRVRTTAGLSLANWVGATANAGLWLAYGIWQRIAQQLLSNLPWFITSFVVGWFLAKDERILRPAAIAAPLAMLGVGLGINATLPGLMAPLGFLCLMVICVPQLVLSWRSPTHQGVSAPAWAASSVASVCWLVYGLGVGDIPVVVSSGPGLLLNLANLWLLTRHPGRTARLGAVRRETAPTR